MKIVKTRPQHECELELVITPETAMALARLVKTGLFGTSLVDVAERLLLERLRTVVLEGWVKP